ncbi:DNA mismatch repair endonuclease MutL [bacterium]|nr:DNA mismatch repair endonuclease MutL [bacterium]
MPRIRELDAVVVNKIAAGEVIERPASVVKELLENSVDALSTRIEVDVADGGAELIRVVDDGEGMHPEDLFLAVTSHATSKISSDDELFSVQTMGFRGEALASIASVSRFRIRTRPEDQSEGCELEVNGGQVGQVKKVGCSAGTLIEVKQLFANTPVRRKFLKTVNTEFGHISEQFSRVAIANPRLHMTLRHNGKLVYEMPGTNRLIDRLRLFYGSDLADKLIEVESEAYVEGSTTERIRLWGYVAHPSVSKSNRKGQYLFLNGRFIQDRSLQHALNEAYRGLLMVNRFPVSYLFLEIPPRMVDVNVHPTKSEVRFRDGQHLYRQLLSTIRNRFLSADLDGTMSAPPKPAAEAAAASAAPTEHQLKFKEELNQWSATAVPSTGEDGSASGQPSEAGVMTLPPPMIAPTIDSAPRVTSATGTLESELQPAGDAGSESGAQSASTDSAEHAVGENVQTTLPSGQRAFQIHDCYIVLAGNEGLTVIDQHALHERILYEHFRHRVLDGSVEAQKLLVPSPVDFSPAEAAMLRENIDVLGEMGVQVEEFGGDTLLLTAYPVMLAKLNPVQLLRDIVDQLDQSGKKPSRRDIIDSLLHMMSCKAAIKAGQRLKPEEIDSLLEQRHLCDDAHHCPHGRPTALVLSRGSLDKQFGRLG